MYDNTTFVMTTQMSAKKKNEKDQRNKKLYVVLNQLFTRVLSYLWNVERNDQ